MDERPKQKIDRRIVKTQKAIRQAFHKLIVTSGIDKITVSALAREADIDRKTFYLHFSSIDELISQEASVIVERVAQALTTPATCTDAPVPLNMKHVLTELAAIVEEDPELYRHVIASLSIDQMVDALMSPVREAALASGQFDTIEDTRGIDYVVRFYIAGTLAAFTQWFTEDRDRPIESIVDIVEQATDGHIALVRS